VAEDAFNARSGTIGASIFHRVLRAESIRLKKQMDMETDGLPKLDNVIFGEVQVLLAEKRTALASLRTGIAVFRVASVRFERAHRYQRSNLARRCWWRASRRRTPME
jgi:hypothetical protein